MPVGLIAKAAPVPPPVGAASPVKVDPPSVEYPAAIDAPEIAVVCSTVKVKLFVVIL